MAKTQQERLLEKQIKQAKDVQRKHEREMHKTATRERAASIVNGQPFVEGFRIMDATAEEALKCLLACERGDENHIAFDDDIFPMYIQRSIGIELEKLVQYGMIGGLISYDNGGFGYLLPPALVYFENKDRAIKQRDGLNAMNTVRTELKKMIGRGVVIQSPKPVDKITKADCAQWTQDVRTFAERYLKEHPSYQPIANAIFFNNIDTLLGYLNSVYEDAVFWEGGGTKTISKSALTEEVLAMYDVFISHANADKLGYVNELKESLDKLKINIFYDKDTLEWGDNWKDKILEGVAKAEFAIIVISENFFGREWTEKELGEFLSRQNQNGQKIILPILHNITVEQLKSQYPAIAEIQALDSAKHSCDEIALKFAAQLIKRLKH